MCCTGTRRSDRAQQWLLLLLISPWLVITWGSARAQGEATGPDPGRDLRALRLAVEDLQRTFLADYRGGAGFLTRVAELERLASAQGSAWPGHLEALRREALLANPLLQSNSVLVVKRKPKPGRGEPGLEIGLPSNHECNSSLSRVGYDNEIAVLSLKDPGSPLRPIYRPPSGGYVGELDLHWDAQRFLFTQSDATNWKIFEARADGSDLRQVSRMPDDVDSFDACYLPNGQIVFGSTASYQAVPCWHGQKKVSNLYLMDREGRGVRQLCFDQDHDLHPVLMPNGQVLYHRWDYTGISHIFLRELMLMNPDGAGQRAIYGSSSWFPNALYFPRPLPGASGRIACILSGYHGVHRMGQFVILDLTRGWHEDHGMVHRISGRGQTIQPLIKDNLVDADWPKFLHPFPLSEKYFLVSAWLKPKGAWGIYLADVFDNLVLLREEPGYALLEPVLLKKSPPPPILPSQIDLSRRDGLVYLHDVHAGPGLVGVPRGTVRSLRVLAYHFGYPNLAGPDCIGYGGPWEVMRILGNVPLESDGSAFFRVPANTPIAVQPLDDRGQAVQWMRSWFTVMPGETVSCVGCHEGPSQASTLRQALAGRSHPRELTPWFGPPRGFDFVREIQPVLDRHCNGCHNGQRSIPLDLRAIDLVTNYPGRRISQLGIDRLPPEVRAQNQGFFRYAPAYDALLPYLRRVGIEDDVSLLVPGEYSADSSPLIQLLRKGHAGVKLDPKAWDRLVTWIDLNAPCHGAWGRVYPIPQRAHQRRMELRKLFGGPDEDPEVLPASFSSDTVPLVPAPLPKPELPHLTGWPFDTVAAAKRQAALGDTEMVLDLGTGVKLALLRIPAGQFVMGDPAGQPDEQPLQPVTISHPFWLSRTEINNTQFHCFNPRHQSGYYNRRHAVSDDQGLRLDLPDLPVVRVSWTDAMVFCRWLSERTGLKVALPTEAQWEYACRAGTAGPFSFGPSDADFSKFANMADLFFSRGLMKDAKQITGGLEHLCLEGAALSDTRFADRSVVTAPVGNYQPNPWGLCDMHGNAAEWTLSLERPYPYRQNDARNSPELAGRRIVRGGSFFDPPGRCRSGCRLSYPQWQRVFNVGFRVVVEGDTAASPLQLK